MKCIMNPRPDIQEELIKPYKEMEDVYSLSCVVGDAMEREQVMRHDMKPKSINKKIIGPAITVKLTAGDIVDCLCVFEIARPGDVIVIDAFGETETSIWGGLMSGELLDALFFHTLLKDSLPDFFVGEEEYDYQAVSDGARTAQKNSFTSAVFKTRIYQKYVHKDKKKAANFLLGVLMYYDCLSICEFKKTEALEEVQFVIAGKRIIAQAVYDILTDIMQEKKVHLLDEDELMAAKGAFRLAELYYKWKEGE